MSVDKPKRKEHTYFQNVIIQVSNDLMVQSQKEKSSIIMGVKTKRVMNDWISEGIIVKKLDKNGKKESIIDINW